MELGIKENVFKSYKSYSVMAGTYIVIYLLFMCE